MFKYTTAIKKLRKLKKRIKEVPGGTSAGKTFGIIPILIQRATKTPLLEISVVSETIPHLKRGAIKDFKKIMMDTGRWIPEHWNATDFKYTFSNNSYIEFFSADIESKVRGPRRNILYINECNNVSFETYHQLAIRTDLEIWLDYNPTNEFWFYTEVQGKRDDVELIIVTYKDNEALPNEIVNSIEQRRNRVGWWKVYGEGQLGEVDGKIYKSWQIIDSVPHEARLERYGIDFGYSNDPTAIVAIYKYNGGYVLDEISYQKGMSNKQIADTLSSIDKALTIADSAEPKSIDEIKIYGINVLPAVKGAGSITQGIAYVQDQQISVTKNSVNIIKEYRNYLWKTDKNTGKIINVPDGGLDHAMHAKYVPCLVS